MTKAEHSFDAIVVGGGHNGLVNGAYLAKSGLRTLVLERRNIVGGAASDLATWRERGVPANATLHGFVPPGQLAARYADLDAVLMPYARTGVGVGGGQSDTHRWCSPMKMFEYMASGRAIISADLPSIREVLNEGNAVFCEPGDTEKWKAAITFLLSDGERRNTLGRQAAMDVSELTWIKREKKILGSFGS